jgi:hypothetical protein
MKRSVSRIPFAPSGSNRNKPNNQPTKPTIKKYGGVNVQIHVLLASILVEDELSAPRQIFLILGERGPVTVWIGGWVGPKIGLDDMGSRKKSDFSAVQPVASRYTD